LLKPACTKGHTRQTGEVVTITLAKKIVGRTEDARTHPIVGRIAGPGKIRNATGRTTALSEEDVNLETIITKTVEILDKAPTSLRLRQTTPRRIPVRGVEHLTDTLRTVDRPSARKIARSADTPTGTAMTYLSLRARQHDK
jgi:hypothetical protein